MNVCVCVFKSVRAFLLVGEMCQLVFWVQAGFVYVCACAGNVVKCVCFRGRIRYVHTQV